MITEEQYQRIKQACLDAHAKGILICKQKWGVYDRAGKYEAVNGCACAIGCLLIGSESSPERMRSAAALLMTTEDDIAGFIDGFDGYVNYANADAADQGRRLRVELLATGDMHV